MNTWKNLFIQQAWKRLFQQNQKLFDICEKSKTSTKPQIYFRTR